MNAFIHHFNFELHSGIRHKQLLFMNYLFPLGFYLLMGFILAEINPAFREQMIPAMLIFSMLGATLMGIPIGLTTARDTGIFRSYKINGVPALSILAIPILTTCLHLLITATFILASAPLLFKAALPMNWLSFALIFVLATLNHASISAVIGVLSHSSRASILWSQLIFVTSVLLGGLMFPHNLLPDAAGKIAYVLPATHAMNAFNCLAMGKASDFSPWSSIIILFLSTILAFAIAVYRFRWE